VADHRIACGAPAQPDIDYCLECDIELAASFAQAREYHDEPADHYWNACGHAPHGLTETIATRCPDPAQQKLDF